MYLIAPFLYKIGGMGILSHSAVLYQPNLPGISKQDNLKSPIFNDLSSGATSFMDGPLLKSDDIMLAF